MDGIAHEWITSDDVTRIRLEVMGGRVAKNLVFISRCFVECSMNELSSVFGEVSYVQYH